MPIATTMSALATSPTSRSQLKPCASAQPLMSILALSILAGCVSTPAGSAGYDAFMDETSPTRLTGPRDAAEAAQCFEDRAKFLPLTAEGAGTRAEWRISPNLDANWLDQFERDRMAPLRHCLGT